MSLKLFRSTGYSSILSPGETRVAVHPGWVILAVSAWAGLACNVALWRGLGAGDTDSILKALALSAVIASATGAVLSLLGWRKTLKPAATLLLLLFALAACSIWAQSLPVDASLMDRAVGAIVFPPWASFLQWQITALLVVLGALPVVWVWHSHVRRLPGPKQLGSNMTGVFLAGLVLAGSGYLWLRALS